MVYQRNIGIIAETTGENVNIRTWFKDYEHEIVLDLSVDLKTMEISVINCEMIKVPYSVCQQTLSGLSALIGTVIAPGVNRRVKRILGRSESCVHIQHILNESFNYAVHVKLDRSLADLTGEKRANAVDKLLGNSCLAFKRG